MPEEMASRDIEVIPREPPPLLHVLPTRFYRRSTPKFSGPTSLTPIAELHGLDEEARPLKIELNPPFARMAGIRKRVGFPVERGRDRLSLTREQDLMFSTFESGKLGGAP